MEQPQLAQILATIPPQNQSLLNQKITNDSHLADIARSLTSWQSACDKLGITEQEEEEIKADNPRLESQKVALLRRWRSKYGPLATYGKLAECLYNAGKPGAVEVICKVLQANGSIPQPAAMQTSLAYSNTQTNPIPQQQPVQPNLWMTGAGYAPPQTSQYPQHTNQYPAGATYQSAYPQPPYAGYPPQPSQYRPQQATQLTPNDLGALKRLIQPVAAYWVALADQLGMTSLVPTIQSTPGNIGPPGYLRDLLNRWLNRGQPTVESLCTALREDDEIIGGSKVADKLEETFRGQGGGVPQTQPPQQRFTASEVNQGNQGYAPVHPYQSSQYTASQHPPPSGSSMYTSFPPSQYTASQHPPPPGGNMSTSVPPTRYTDPGPQAPGVSSQAHPESSGPGVIRRGDRPTLPNLNKFPVKHGKPINIPVQIGTNYRTFGTFLLEDDYGAVVSVIERTMNFDSERINGDILMRWIRGQGKKPITWGTLITCLRDLELGTLANDIEEALQ